MKVKRILGQADADRNFGGQRYTATWLAVTLSLKPQASAPASGTVIAKSIHAQLSHEWIVAEFDVIPLVLVRHPASVLAS